MAQARQQDLLAGESEQRRLAKEISDRLSQEIVIALVGPVGSGVSEAARYFHELLTQEFQYSVADIIKPSKFIRDEAHRVGEAIPPRIERSDYIDTMQTAGNKLREKYGPNYLAEKTIEHIVKYRRFMGGYSDEGGKQTALPGRRAYIIDSIKNLEEHELLRQIYGETLVLVGVFAPDAVRHRRLVDGGVAKEDVKKIVDRDQGEVTTFGQKTRKVFELADFFVCNDQTKDELRKSVRRYLHLIFDTSIHTPTRDEAAMYEASAIASNSACMSRQVGAAILSERGEMISVGWNDVPRSGGGLYVEDHRFTVDPSSKRVVDGDHRCFKWGGNICHNETRRNKILDEIAVKVSKSEFVKRGTTAEEIRDLLVGTAIDSLTEYSRSIHAEMEAILSVAREGKHSLVGATLYTTTYPCHSCARHIVAAGITAVVYVQPYLKSLATQLHEDAVTEERDKPGHVIFRQYDGVAPRNFLQLFRPTADRKKNGVLHRPDPRFAVPIFRIPLDGPVDYESKVIADLVQKEQDSDV